MHYTLRTN